jgi:3-dehydroshikimate dehydratase
MFMILSICTISFRHQLISIEQLALWAQKNHFQGIELWGTHAKNLAPQADYNKEWLAGFGLKTTMLSDYLPLKEDIKVLQKEVALLSQLAKHWGTKKIRTFAGDLASNKTTPDEFLKLANTLRQVCDWLAEHHLTLVIEVHPNTFADTVASTQKLFEYVGCDNLKLNFDVLHVWESKADVIKSFEILKPYINHFHLKNVSSEELLSVFSPATVYSASGSREGIVPLFDGQVNYNEFLSHINQHADLAIREMEASLEWFGNHSKEILTRDRYLIQQLQQNNEPLLV